MLTQKIEVEVHSDQKTFLKSLPCGEFADKGKPRTAIWLGPKKKCGFPVSRPYLAFGRRNPDPKLFYWIVLVSVSTYKEKVCGKLKFEAILGKFIFGCGSTD